MRTPPPRCPNCPKCREPMSFVGHGFGVEGTRASRTEHYVCRDCAYPTTLFFDRHGMPLAGESFAAGPRGLPDRMIDSEVG